MAVVAGASEPVGRLYLPGGQFRQCRPGCRFFHLQAGMADHGGAGKMITAVLYTLCMLGVLVSVTWLSRHDQRWRLMERFLALGLLATNPLLFGLGQRSAAVVADDADWLDHRYVAPFVRSERCTKPAGTLSRKY